MDDQYRDMKSFVAENRGEDYKKVLASLHQCLRPKSYLEIGSRTGSSLALSCCPTIAIDPEFRLKGDFMGDKPFCGLFRTTSDNFFSAFDPKVILGGPIDLAFLDGLHLAEFLLRDFANVERHCKRNSIIVMHDCIPTDVPMARRREHVPDAEKSVRHPGWWTGDVWKFAFILQKYRKDLRFLFVDAVPTGLVIVTKLDPQSTFLTDSYYETLDELSATSDDMLANYFESISILSTMQFETLEDLSKHFWL